MNIVTFLLLYFSKSLSVALSAASSLYSRSAHIPCTALFIADNGIMLVLLSCQRHVLCLCHVSLPFQGVNSSGEQFISTPHRKWVYFQSAQCRCGAFPPSEQSHSWNMIFALPYMAQSLRHVTGAIHERK